MNLRRQSESDKSALKTGEIINNKHLNARFGGIHEMAHGLGHTSMYDSIVLRTPRRGAIHVQKLPVTYLLSYRL